MSTPRMNPIMSMEDESAALAVDLRRVIAERDELAREVVELRAEVATLAARLRQSPTVREVVGELRAITALLSVGESYEQRQNGRLRLAELLRRLDETEGSK